MELTNELMKQLMALDKYINNNKFKLPLQGEDCKVNLCSKDNSTLFLLDISRTGRFESKAKLQTRYQNNVLVRLEINSPEHQNPDGTWISRNHIHIYDEITKLQIAYDLKDFDLRLFKNISNFLNLFDDYCNFNNIKCNSIQGVIQ